MNNEVYNQIAREAIQVSNIQYGLIFLISSVILSLGAWTIYKIYKAYSLDIEAKIFTNIVAFVLLCIPLYFWTNSLINLIHVNCFPNHYVYKNLNEGNRDN